MDNKSRAYIYAFLSKLFANRLEIDTLNEIKKNEALLQTIGENSFRLFQEKSVEEMFEELSVEYTTIFLMNAQPIESSIIDSKDEILIGLQNPVMQFYFSHGYDVNMSNTHIQTPDHISIELGFMQNLVLQENYKIQEEFLSKHLLNWVPPYLIGCKSIANTTFYNDLFDFTVEFLFSEYELIKESIKNG
jgi:TorA maturation chaperone TorD